MKNEKKKGVRGGGRTVHVLWQLNQMTGWLRLSVSCLRYTYAWQEKGSVLKCEWACSHIDIDNHGICSFIYPRAHEPIEMYVNDCRLLVYLFANLVPSVIGCVVPSDLVTMGIHEVQCSERFIDCQSEQVPFRMKVERQITQDPSLVYLRLLDLKGLHRCTPHSIFLSVHERKY